MDGWIAVEVMWLRAMEVQDDVGDMVDPALLPISVNDDLDLSTKEENLEYM